MTNRKGFQNGNRFYQIRFMKVLICNNREILRAGLKQLLLQWSRIKYIKEANDGKAALTLLRNENFDIVLLDFSLPGVSGLELLKLIKAKWQSTNVLILGTDIKEQDVISAFRLGASGYLATDAASKELFIAVKKVEAGGKYISNMLAEKLAFYVENTNTVQHEMLSKREYATMIKLAKGESLQEIGNELSISAKTVSTYRTRVMRKMNLSKNTQLTKYCLENELI